MEKKLFLGVDACVKVYENGNKYFMEEHQKKLLHLPIPSLDATCNRLNDVLLPLCNSVESVEETVKTCIEELRTDFAYLDERLRRLEESDERYKKTSWLAPFWSDVYLCGRDALPVNVNYFFALNVPKRKDRLETAAGLVSAAFAFRDLMLHEKLHEDGEAGKNPLDMSQFPFLFNTARIPRRERDDYVHFDTKESHIIVIFHGVMYKIEIHNYNYVSVNAILHRFYDVYHERNVNGNGKEEIEGIGYFTALNRDKWADVRFEMVANTVNEISLRTIDEAAFILCLDDEDVEDSLQALSPVLLHNRGYNRWFDKLQIIITKDGRAGMNNEHTFTDGSTTLQLASFIMESTLHIVDETDEDDDAAVDKEADDVNITKLSWNFTPKLIDQLKSAKISTEEELFDKVESRCFHYKGYGKLYVITNRLSPDAWVQMALQLAYFKCENSFGATYESAATRRFLHGRTEVIRPLIPKTIEFVHKMFNIDNCSNKITSSSSSDKEKVQSLRAVIADLVKQMQLCKDGQGVDRHLLGLSKMVKEGERVPLLFSNETYLKFKNILLSTSNCGGSALNAFGFGPVSDHCYGVGYFINNSSISFNITTWKGSGQDAHKFASELIWSLNEMKDIFHDEIPKFRIKTDVLDSSVEMTDDFDMFDVQKIAIHFDPSARFRRFMGKWAKKVTHKFKRKSKTSIPPSIANQSGGKEGAESSHSVSSVASSISANSNNNNNHDHSNNNNNNNNNNIQNFGRERTISTRYLRDAFGDIDVQDDTGDDEWLVHGVDYHI